MGKKFSHAYKLKKNVFGWLMQLKQMKVYYLQSNKCTEYCPLSWMWIEITVRTVECAKFQNGTNQTAIWML